LILIHGFLSSAALNWIHPGHAAAIAANGYRVILPDLRGHGRSARPVGPDAYPRDVLADDALALLAHLGLTHYDLGGYSLGARTAVRLMARGARPGRLVIAGMGLQGIEEGGGGDYFRRVLTGPDTFPRGSVQHRTRTYVRLLGEDPEALLRVLESSVTTSRADLGRISVPTQVVVGADDRPFRHGAEDLTALLPDARLAVIPGDHTSCVGHRDLGRVIADFLGAPPDVSAA
jgi:pimeloyl-ACP methyl ester carboxylesterase